MNSLNSETEWNIEEFIKKTVNEVATWSDKRIYNNTTKSFYQFSAFASRAIQLKNIQQKHQNEKRIQISVQLESCVKLLIEIILYAVDIRLNWWCAQKCWKQKYLIFKTSIKNEKYNIYCNLKKWYAECSSTRIHLWPVTDLTDETVADHWLWSIHSHRKKSNDSTAQEITFGAHFHLLDFIFLF